MKFIFGVKSLTWGALAMIAFSGCEQPYTISQYDGPAVLGYGQSAGVSDNAQWTVDSWTDISSLDVGQLPIGSTSKAFADLRNTGLRPAQVTSMIMTSGDGTVFAMDNKCAKVILPGDRCRIYTSFTPDNLGVTAGSLSVVYDDGRSSSKTIVLPLTAKANNLAFLKFEVISNTVNPTTIGYTGTVDYKVIYNGSHYAKNGNSILPARGVTISDPANGTFTIDHSAATTCGAVVNADCIIRVIFTPTVTTAQNSNFSLSYFNGAENLSTQAQANGSGLTAVVLATLGAGASDFGSVVANPATPKGLAIPITFTGSVPATNIVITGPAAGAFTLSTDPSLTTCMNTGISGACQLYVLFNPTATIAYTGSITIGYKSNTNARPTLTIPLTGTGVAPAHLTLSAATLAFGNVPAHQPITKSITLKNDGGVPVSTLSVITASDKTDFTPSFQNTCGTLAAGSSCTFSVVFKPASASALSSTFAFTYFDGRVNQPVSLSATGTGTAPLYMNPGYTIDFGNIMIGALTTPTPASPTLQFFGTTPLTTASQLVVTPNTLSSPFSFSGNGSFPGGGTCVAPLNPNTSSSCTFKLALSTTTGFPADTAVTQNFTVAYTGDSSGGGSGTLTYIAKMTPRNPPALAIVTPIAAFGTVSVNDSQTISLTLKNSSAYFATSFKSITLTGADSSSFSVASNGCNGVVANGTCVISLKFTPKSAATFNASLSYVYSNGISDQTITNALSGVGSAKLTIRANPTTIDFGTVYVGDTVPSKPAALSVYGVGAWAGTSNVASPFSITPQACGTTASDCSLTVGFTPTAAGTFNSTVTYTYAPGLTTPSTVAFTFKGVAVNRTPTLAFTSTGFPKTIVGQTASQTINIKNTGTSAANSLGLTIGSGNFAYAASGGPGTTGHCATSQNLAPGDSCTVTISFAPTDVGSLSSLLTANFTDPASGTAANTSTTLSGTGTQMIQIFAGGYQSCMINELGKAVCWGQNANGQLGQGSTAALTQKVQSIPAINLGTGNQLIKLSLGDAHTCALMKNTSSAGFVVCWGNNQGGRLGLGITDENSLNPLDGNGKARAVNLGTGEIAVDVAAGFEHTCAALKSGKVKCWGGNTSGQLGIDNTNSIGTTTAQMGDALQAANLGGGQGVSVSAGAGHSCAVLKDGSTRCWGDNFYGQLGQGRIDEQVGNAAGEMASLSAINLWSTLNAQSTYASSGAFTCVLSTAGEVKCFGKLVANESTTTPFYGVYGACWARAAHNTVAKPCATNPNLSPSSSFGYLASDMGANLPIVNLNGVATTQLSVGRSFACSLGSDNSVRCFGFNQDGQLGQGTTASVGASDSEMGSSLKTSLTSVASIGSGYEHSCTVLQNNTVKCWGSASLNATGLASLGVTGDTGVNSATSPGALPVVYDGR